MLADDLNIEHFSHISKTFIILKTSYKLKKQFKTSQKFIFNSDPEHQCLPKVTSTIP